MNRPFGSLSLAVLAATLLVGTHRARGGPPPPGFAWEESLAQALATAKAEGKPVMICINASRVWQRTGRLEPAAKELREKTYRHPDVVELSKHFCCVFISSDGTAEDFGELRANFEIDGDIVSPQHVFAYPDGRLLYRKEYWPYGTGQDAVDALLTMMRNALAKHHARERGESPTTGEGETPDDSLPPEDAEGREKWIAAKLRAVGGSDEVARRDALRHLVDADRDGDVLGRVLALLKDYDKQPVWLRDVVRELGRPGLEAAVQPLCKLLTHKDTGVRAHAAVSLEFIGSTAAVKALTSRIKREKDPATTNHMFRALGRCGAYDAKVRKALLKAIKGADSEFVSFGPIIGLAYFAKDEKTARALEDLIREVGLPSGGRGGFQGAGKRSLLAWCLSEVGFGDPKAVEFVEQVMIPAVPDSRWSRGVRSYYEAVRDVCGGDEDEKLTVENGARRAVSGGGAGGRFGGRGSGNPTLTDAARLHRTHLDFTPKGEFGPIGG